MNHGKAVAAKQLELTLLVEQREAVRESYLRHIKAASSCRREGRRLDGLIEKAAKGRHTPTPKEG